MIVRYSVIDNFISDVHLSSFVAVTMSPSEVESSP